MAARPSPRPATTQGSGEAVPSPAEPPETLAELTGEIRGLADYVRAVDARTAEVQKALKAPQRRTPVAAERAPRADATRYRTTALVLVVLIVTAAAVVGLRLLLQAGVLQVFGS